MFRFNFKLSSHNLNSRPELPKVDHLGYLQSFRGPKAAKGEP